MKSIFHSPLGRHPGLLARATARRLGIYREDVPVPPAPVSEVAYPAHWATHLREWVAAVPLEPPAHVLNRVFGQDFDEATLLRLCREGPISGERGLTGDIKLVWEYSRGQPLFTNAAIDPVAVGPCADFIRRWSEAAADINGPAWSCAMEIAIRAVNWTLADVLFDRGLGHRVGPSEWAWSLWRHGWLIWRRLEARLISSNHYLADLLGLLVMGSLFPGDGQARKWVRFARAEFPRALLAQTREDGGLAEGSLRYHGYVAEMALLFRLIQGTPFDAKTEIRMRQMCQIVADFRDAQGDLFGFGDDDTGRILALDAASTVGHAEVLLRLASSVFRESFVSQPEAVYPESGWWVRRRGEFTVAMEFGGVGLHGLGGHAHNDDLSFCLDWRGRPIIVDPGTFVYTSDPAARNRFRSTFSHNVLIVDGREQRELNKNVFALRGSDSALSASPLSNDAWIFRRPAGPGIEHLRGVVVQSEQVTFADALAGTGSHQLEWRFHVHPAVRARVVPKGFALEVPGEGTLLLEAAGVALKLGIAPSEFSPGYGRREQAFTCTATGQPNLPCQVQWRISVSASADKSSP